MSVVFVEGKTERNPLGGWKVQAYNGRRMRSKFFSRKAPKNVPQKTWDHFQKLKAEQFNALCMANSAAVKYIRFVRQDFATTKPKRGIGIHAFNLAILPKNREEDAYYCGFVVYPAEGNQKRFIIRSPRHPFSKVLRRAIDFWAESHNIRDKDRQRILNNLPGPECFKELRRQMNKEGHNIPVSAISDAFWEQRNEMGLKRIERVTKTPSLAPEAAEIAQWFEAQIKDERESA